MDHKHDVFISYNTRDQKLVTTLATRLKNQQIRVFLDRWHLIAGQPWPERLTNVLRKCSAVIVCLGPNEMGPWQQREMYFALERQIHEPEFPVIPVLLPDAKPSLDFLTQNTWVDFRGGLEESLAFNILLAAIRKEALEPELQSQLQGTINSICPYRGLHFFREQDAAFFFGRDTAIQKLEDKLVSHPFVALVGASGAGKSSLVRAGLLPKLRKDTREPWEIVTIVPGDRPYYNLAAALVPLLETDKSESDLLIEIAKQAEAFQIGSLQIRDVVERILQKQLGTKRFLLVVDQWEEIYTLAAFDSKSTNMDKPQFPTCKSFIDGILDACQAGKIVVVITLRGDFMGHAFAYRRLSDQMQNAQINLGPMNQEELQQAIELPARKINLNFEPGLVDTLLADVGEEPGNLPLLEFALELLWQQEKQNGRLIRHQTYRNIGRIKGALAQKANEVYKKLSSDEERQQLQYILLQLVQSYENNEYTRRRASLDDLGTHTKSIINRLTDARLVVSNHDSQSGGYTLEVAHEALIRDWPQFREWLRQDRDFLLWHERLRFALSEWEKIQDPKSLLYGHKLVDAKRWLNYKKNELTQKEKEYINNSVFHSQQTKMISTLMVLLPLAIIWFFSWSANNNLSPSIGIAVLLAKSKIPVLQSEPEMMVIPPDKTCLPDSENCVFKMGSAEENEKSVERLEWPQHNVKFNKNYKIGRYEVTFEEYQVFAYLLAQDGGCKNKNKDNQPHQISPINDSGWGKDSRPVIHVNWYDAQCYVIWLSERTHKNYHLPSEAQWEYAARAGTISDSYWQENEDPKRYAWFNYQESQPVGKKEPNRFNLFDISGNVWEWVDDCWHDSYKGAPTDGSSWQDKNDGDCSQRVLRGGSWSTPLPDILRSAFRNTESPDFSSSTVGFRVALD